MMKRLALFAALAMTAPAHAEVQYAEVQYDGHSSADWVGPDGRIIRDRGPDAAAYIGAAPANREQWLGECVHRLDLANQGHGAVESYQDACTAWLSYYEAQGYARNGYGFAYAIPVSLETTTIARDCPRRILRPAPVRRRPVPDKRIKL
jgi:hypothetical protein